VGGRRAGRGVTVAAPPRVPFLDLLAGYAELRDELDGATARVLGGGRYVLGAEVARFEDAWAAYTGTAHCVGVASGLDALHLSLVAMGVGEGDEVIVPSNTFIATWLAVSRACAVPVPVEPDPRTSNIDPDRIAAAVTPRTRAVLPVHLYGLAAEMDRIRDVADRHGLAVLEDAAQAHGARRRGAPAGGLGHAAAWSFYPGKNLGAFGDGGAVTTDDPAVAERLRSLRNYGSSVKYVNRERGFNSRLDELQAAMLTEKLAVLDAWNARRRAIAERYLEGLDGLPLALPAHDPGHVWHVFAVHTPERDALAAHLDAEGVATLVHYPIPPHLQGAYRDLGLAEGDLPIAERLARETLSLPMGPHLRADDADRVVAAVAGFHRARG